MSKSIEPHAQHEHLTIEAQLSRDIPDHPDDGNVDHPIGIMFQDDFDEEIWEGERQYDDEFRQECIDFSFEAADNLKQALLKEERMRS